MWWLGAVVGVALACAPAARAETSQIRIVGGSTANQASYPYQVALFRSGSFRCGGSIVNATTIITAAHCVTDQNSLLGGHSVYPASGFTIGYGSGDLGSTTRVAVSQITVPSPYVSSTDESYDVARLTLSQPIAYGPNAQPIALAGSGTSKTAGVATVTGWGATAEGGASASQLRVTQLDLRDDGACQSEYTNEYVPARSVCAGGTTANGNANPDTCQGDSGGPLAVDDGSGRQVLLGVTSYGNGCGRDNTPGVYAWVQGSGIADFLAGFDVAQPQAPAPAAAPAAPALGDVVAPTVRYSRFACTKKRRCTVRLRAADNLGPLAKLSVKVSRKVRSCTRRGGRKRCRTVTRSKTLKPKRVTGGFTATATFARATYTLTAVGTDASGNRSKPLRRTLRLTR